jgi:hypothetical protein
METSGHSISLYCWHNGRKANDEFRNAGIMTNLSNRWATFLAAVCGLIASTAYGQGVNWKVDHESVASNPDGLSWLTAYPNLQDAFEAADPGDTIFVADGVYFPPDGIDNPPQDLRDAAFALRDGVAIYGGFQGISHPDGPETEDELSDRNWIAHVTVLDGDIGVAGDHTDNSIHVVTAIDVNVPTRLDGFTIRHGRAVESEVGGGMLMQDSSPLILNCTFEDNTAAGGGALFIDGQASGRLGPQCINCTFSANTSGNRGGAAWVRKTDAIFYNCLFYGNLAAKGGGLFTETGLIVWNCTLAFNHATSGGPSDVGGGGIAFDTGSVNVANSILWGNTDAAGSDQDAQIDPNDSIEPEFIAISYSCIQNWTGEYGGSGNTGEDPLFLNASQNNFRLGSLSPSLDGGNSTFLPDDVADLDMDNNFGESMPLDLDFKPRSAFDIPDMGAYEFQSTCPEDIFPANSASRCGDGDATIGSGDLAELLSNWGDCPGCCADLFPTAESGGGDGVVAAGDLGQLNASWGPCGGEGFGGPEGGGGADDSNAPEVVALMQALETIGYEDVESFLAWTESAPDSEVDQMGYILQTILDGLGGP